jgi:predicted dinucleotide-binding enzyme
MKSPMHIGIIGAGHVGGTLGRRFAAIGHTVTFGARDPAKTRAELADPTLAVGPIPDLRGCDAVILATPWAGTVAAIQALDPVPGQIVIDATNPIAGRLEGLSPGGSDSGGETVQRAAPQARVVKAFNTCGYEVMADPSFAQGNACMPVCGDDAEARRLAMALARAIGFDPLDCGPLRHARYVEPMAMVWITRAILLGAGRRWAFATVG